MTVTVEVFVEWHPPRPVTVSAKVVVRSGDAAVVQLFGSESAVCGDQEQLTPPEPVSGVEVPAQIVAEPDATAIGFDTVTVTVGAFVDLQALASGTVSV